MGDGGGGSGLDRERLEELVERGMTIRQIAEEVGRCEATVRHWLGRHGLRTQGAARRPREAVSAERSVLRECRTHGETDFVLSGDGYYRCRRCRVESVVRRRRRVKELLAQEAGGACALCGYDRYLGALQFHHVDPAAKRLGLSRAGVTLAIDVLREEARKCVLLCSNCHAEVEGGVRELSVD